MQLCVSLSILWDCLSLGFEWILTFSSPVATAEFSKFAGRFFTTSAIWEAWWLFPSYLFIYSLIKDSNPNNQINGEVHWATCGSGKNHAVSMPLWTQPSPSTLNNVFYWLLWGLPDGSVVKNPPANAGDVDMIPGWERSPRGGNDNLLQYSCLDKPMDRAVRQSTFYGVAKCWARLSEHTCIRIKLTLLLFLHEVIKT